MFKRKRSTDRIDVRLTGPVQGQVAIGREITQHQTAANMTVTITADERSALEQAITELRAEVEAGAPPEKKAQALERIDELDEALSGPEPDLTTMRYVRGWFARHLPALVGSVVGVVVHPVVGKLVEAAGDAAVAGFKQLLDEA